MPSAGPAVPLALDPTLLGPLESRGKPDGAFSFGPERDPADPAVARKTALLNTLGDTLRRHLRPDERLLYAFRATECVSLLRMFALGWLSRAYHSAALVLTDRRLIEIQLDPNGRKPDDRVRTIPWEAVREIALSMSRFRVVPAGGRRLAWVVAERADRGVLRALSARIRERLLTGQPVATTDLPFVHCPGCAAPMPPRADTCESCGAFVRSRKLAAGLSLAFPGAGLFYLGHPVLGSFDLVGEVMFFGLTALLLATASSPGDTIGAAGAGAVLLLITKLESLHVGEVLSARRRAETPEHRAVWRRRLALGGGASLVALALAGAGAGRLVGTVDRDLEFVGLEEGWTRTGDLSQARAFPGDPDLRAEWVHAEGWAISVFAHPIAFDSSFEALREEIVEGELGAGMRIVREDEALPGALTGFRLLERASNENGTEFAVVRYVVLDPEHDDAHTLLAVARAGDADRLDARARELLDHAVWTLRAGR